MSLVPSVPLSHPAAISTDQCGKEHPQCPLKTPSGFLFRELNRGRSRHQEMSPVPLSRPAASSTDQCGYEKRPPYWRQVNHWAQSEPPHSTFRVLPATATTPVTPTTPTTLSRPHSNLSILSATATTVSRFHSNFRQGQAQDLPLLCSPFLL